MIENAAMHFPDEFPTGRETPRLAGWDQSLAFLADPYRFISKQCLTHDSDVVQARIMLQPTVLMTGSRAAELFYDKDRFARENAAPEVLRAALFGKSCVQGLDGAAHLQRKRFFMASMAPEYVDQLIRIAEQVWPAISDDWAQKPRIELFSASQQWLARSVCNWAGISVPPHELPRRTRHLAALFNSAGSGLFGHMHARIARYQTEFWLARKIAEDRRGLQSLRERSLAWGAARLTDAEGQLLPARIAAVELLNVLRPTVAVSVFVTLAAHALHRHPEWAERIKTGNDADLTAFVEEVRRFYPFSPAVAARVRHDFSWEGHQFEQGRRVLLDIYGTNHDPRIWTEPQRFDPERFLKRTPSRFEFIPQGGGDAHANHRCPGEGIAIGLMKLAVSLLVNRSQYTVPPQNLEIRMNRLPALPADRFCMSGFTPILPTAVPVAAPAAES